MSAVPDVARLVDPDVARFGHRLRRLSNGCVEHMGSTNGVGYARFYYRGRLWLSHRYAYMVAHGHPVPEGLVIDHLCRNRRCVNPAHLEAVTIRTNNLRGFGASGINAAKTHCKRGHEFTPANTIVERDHRGTMRRCRTCHNALRRGGR